MGYKDKMKLNGADSNSVISPKIDVYFVELGFYEDTMHPRFMNAPEYDNLRLKVPALRHGYRKDDSEYWVRIFISKYEAYLEIETPWRSYETSRHYQFDNPPTTISEVEKALDDLTDGL